MLNPNSFYIRYLVNHSLYICNAPNTQQMPTLELTTKIKSTMAICFDLSTSIDLHTISTNGTHEKAVAGTTKGLIGLDETVTWQATHFGIKQQLTSKITAFDRPTYFRDEQMKGAFKSIYHEHLFEQRGETVIMKDIFYFESPCGILGRLFNWLILTNYMKRFLLARNKVIKDYAESDKWQNILKEASKF